MVWLRRGSVDGCGCGGGAVTTTGATTGRATLALFSPALLGLILCACLCGSPFWTPLCTAALQPAVDRLRHLGAGQRHNGDAGMQPRLCREPCWRRRDDHLHQWRLDERGRVLRLEPDPGLTSSACFSRPVQSLTAVLLPIFCSHYLRADVRVPVQQPPPPPPPSPVSPPPPPPGASCSPLSIDPSIGQVQGSFTQSNAEGSQRTVQCGTDPVRR